MLEQARRDDLCVFDCPDHHLHLAARCDRAAAGRLTHRITSSLKQRLGLPVGFVQYPPRPIEDNRHLYYTVRYILRQRHHHGLVFDPRAEASSLADLLGFRVLGRYTLRNVQRWLPRLHRSDVLDLWGQSARQLDNIGNQITDLREPMRAAGCLTELAGTSRELIALRTAVISAVDGQLSTSALAVQLGVSLRTVQRLRARQPEPGLVRALRLQLCLNALAPRKDGLDRMPECG